MDSIQVTGNKPSFNNYLTDPIILESNSKVTINKTSFSIPVWTQNFIKMPSLDVAEHDITMCNIIVSGVNEPITWREFHTAWDALNSIEDRGLATFYNGTYNFYMNNLLSFFIPGPPAEIKTIPTFTETLCKALSTKFLFYEFSSSDIISNKTDVSIIGGDTITINTVEYTVTQMNTRITNLGFTCEYAPEKNTQQAPTQMDNPAGAANNKWSFVNSRLLNDENIDFNYTGTGSATPEAFAIATGPTDAANSQWAIDPNGGYWTFRPNTGNDPCDITCGILFMNDETKINLTNPPVIVETDIRMGIHFHDTAGTETYRAVDGIQYDGDGDEALKYYPTSDIFEYDNDLDVFYILIRRATSYESSSGKYIFKLLQGDLNRPGITNAKTFYQSSFNLPSPSIKCVPAIICSQTGGSAAGGARVDDNYIIPVSQQSLDMGQFYETATPGQFGSNYFSDKNITFYPALEIPNDNNTIMEFWNQIGTAQTEVNGNQKTSYESTELSSSISWPLGAMDTKYFIGVDETKQIFLNNRNHLELNNANSSATIPRQVEISLMNLSHTPHAGSHVGEVIFTEQDINKVVSYINTDPSYFDTTNNVYLEYVYESFNLVYRKLNNVSKFPLNNFQVKIGYKDFLTNSERVIQSLRGICKIEFLFDKN
tara:strand:+ start:239 stop:2203 length:1965 start_codon:yes stop_codon:yes gene_type:complete